MKQQKKIAIIPARGGSKRIPRKNIKEFLGKPIIAYSIEESIRSGIFDEVMVSTDDPEIALIAKKYGAQVPFIRSQANSNDFATTSDVLIEVLNDYQNMDRTFDYGCCLYPTAPFVTSKKITQSFDLLINYQADSVVPVCQFGSTIWRSLKIEEGKLTMNFPKNIATRSQDLPLAYYDVGQFYSFDVQKFLSTQKLFSNFTIPLIIDELEAQDIDNENDWRLAEIKYQFMKNKIENGDR